MVSAIYFALAEAVGEGVLEDANKILSEAIDSGAIDDVYTRSALRTLIRTSSRAVAA